MQDRDRRESSEVEQQEQDTMKGMLKLMLHNHNTFQDNQKTL